MRISANREKQSRGVIFWEGIIILDSLVSEWYIRKEHLNKDLSYSGDRNS